MAAAKILTYKGAAVVLSPAVYEKINKSHSPTRSYVTVQADGSYGCAPHDGKGCKDHRGFIGIVKPYKPTILTENDLNTAFSKEKESKLGAGKYLISQGISKNYSANKSNKHANVACKIICNLI